MTAPALLSSEQAEHAFKDFVLPGILSAMDNGLVKRPHLHVVVLKPGIPYTEGDELPVLFAHSIGKKENWRHFNGETFDDFAKGKVHITWRTGLSSREVILTKPGLLLPKDVTFWGSDIVGVFPSAASGVEPYFDEMWARQTSAAMAAVASQNMVLREGSAPTTNFL